MKLIEVEPSFLEGRRYKIETVFELRWNQPENASLRLQQKVGVSITGDEELNLKTMGNKYIETRVIAWLDVPTV